MGMTLRLSPQRFRQIRAERGLNIPAIARLCGVSEITVRTWSSGRHNPNEENLGKLAGVLGVDAEEITSTTCPTCGQQIKENGS